MLGLAQEIGGADLGIDAVIGDNQRLGRAREQVDTDAAKQLSLGLCDISIARADDHVDGGNGVATQRHGGNRLHATQDVDLVGTAEVHGRDDRAIGPAPVWRGTGDNAFHPGHAGRDDRHMGRGDHRITPAGNVAADRTHRDVFVAQDDAGQGLNLKIL